ncbi:protein FAM107B isoform X2 [Brachyhypopomus gauderio]|uniref:protein FAM107B isoform X2 n=1 Tax=Brachyhypopomus gauderio TaxID=698409 RepID=UPI004041BA86
MRAAASHALPVRASERDPRDAPRPPLRTSNNTAANSHVSSRGHDGENTDEHGAGESPWNQNNPVKASRTHQELHRELLLAHRKGLVVSTKPELQMVLERRKREQTQREEGEQDRSPLEQVLLKRQQKQQEREKEQEEKIREEIQLLEFVRVRQNLRKVHSALQKKTNPGTLNLEP